MSVVEAAPPGSTLVAGSLILSSTPSPAVTSQIAGLLAAKASEADASDIDCPAYVEGIASAPF